MATNYANWFATHELIGGKWRKRKQASAQIGASAAPSAPAAPTVNPNDPEAIKNWFATHRLSGSSWESRPNSYAQGAKGIPAAQVNLSDDAQAVAARAKAIFEANQKRETISATGAFDDTDLNEYIRRLDARRPDDERNSKNAANAQNLASSSTMVRALDDIAAQYTRDRGDAQSEHDRRASQRAADLAANEQALGLTNADIDAALLDRATEDSGAAAAQGLLPTGESAAKFAPGVEAPPNASDTEALKRWLGSHVYVNGVWLNPDQAPTAPNSPPASTAAKKSAPDPKTVFAAPKKHKKKKGKG